MKIIWYFLAKLLAYPPLVRYLIKRARRTPYAPILSPDGKEVYMERLWLFNPYPTGSMGKRSKWQFPISIRLHCIRTPDEDRHLHDHPWNCRTIILRGCYLENRQGDFKWRNEGETAQLKFGKDYHRIQMVCKRPEDEGVWTMFITGKYRGTWGFDVDGIKVPFREYLKSTGDAMSKEIKNGS